MDTKFLLDFPTETTWEITCPTGCVLYSGYTSHGFGYQFDLTWFVLNTDGHICNLPELTEGEILPTEKI